MEQIVYFNPGDVVQLRQDIPHKPLMVVMRKEVSFFKRGESDEKKTALIGIKCRWFTSDGYLQEAVFSTKDLILIEASSIKDN